VQQAQSRKIPFFNYTNSKIPPSDIMWAVKMFQSKKRRSSDSVYGPSSKKKQLQETAFVGEQSNYQYPVCELENRLLRGAGLLADDTPIRRRCVEYRPNITEDDEASRKNYNQQVIELENRLRRCGLLADDSPIGTYVECRPNSTSSTDEDDEISSPTSTTHRIC
jgi:hypothetical protein